MAAINGTNAKIRLQIDDDHYIELEARGEFSLIRDSADITNLGDEYRRLLPLNSGRITFTGRYIGDIKVLSKDGPIGEKEAESLLRKLDM